MKLPEIITIQFDSCLITWCDRGTWDNGEIEGNYIDVDFDYGDDYIYLRCIGLEITFTK